MEELEQRPRMHDCAGCGRAIAWELVLCWECREPEFHRARRRAPTLERVIDRRFRPETLVHGLGS